MINCNLNYYNYYQIVIKSLFVSDTNIINTKLKMHARQCMHNDMRKQMITRQGIIFLLHV